MSVLEAVFKAFESDPEGASYLVDEAVSNWMLDELDKREPWLQVALAGQVAAVTAVAKRQLARSYVELMASGSYPDEEIQKTAEWLAGLDAYAAAVTREAGDVRKALLVRNEQWRSADNGSIYTRRTARNESGQFTRLIDTGVTSNPTGIADIENVSPYLRKTGAVHTTAAGERVWGETHKDDEPLQRRAAQHQAQWEQMRQYSKELADAYTGPTAGVGLSVQVLHSDGKQDSLKVPLSVARHGMKDWEKSAEGGKDLNHVEDTILSVTLVGGSSDEAKASVARFNALGAVGDTGLARFSGTKATDWQDALAGYDSGKDKTRLTQLFGNLGAGGKVLQAVPGAQKYGDFAALVGSMGPTAEQALDPHVRRAAYRYRGTEKTPDAALREEYVGREMSILNRLADNPPPDKSLVQVLDPNNEWRGSTRDQTTVAGSTVHRARQGASGDQLKMQVASDVAVEHLVSTLPRDPLTAQLSEKAGHVLPSQGVLLNDKGQLISQAVGYADDHYLPFDLKNMGRLRGGQYVRTRVQGGLTGEDVYASVQTGARMATVVSSSGVFSLELDPAFRGARGNSDKARSMYTRYLQILDAVQESGMYLKDLPPAQKDAVRETHRVMHPEMYGPEADKEVREASQKAALNEARATAMQLGGDERLRLQAEAEAQARKEMAHGASPEKLARRQEEIYDELKAHEMEGKVVQLALNAAGYKAALETLQQQFPYFIRNVSYEPLRSGKSVHDPKGFYESRHIPETMAAGIASSRVRATDRGYVQPGALRPSGTQEGFYNAGSTDRRYKKPSATTDEDKTDAAPGGEAGPKAVGGSSGAGASSPAAAADLRNRLRTELADRAKADQERHAKALTEMLTASTPTPTGETKKTWGEVAEGDDDVEKAKVLLQQMANSRYGELTDPRAIAALSNQGAVDTAFRAVWGGSLQDALVDDQALSARFNGAKDQVEAAREVALRAAAVVRSASTTDPFASSVTGAFGDNKKPQPFPEMVGITNRAQLKTATASTLATTKELSDVLFAGGADRANTDAAEAVADLKKVYDQLPKLREAANAQGMTNELFTPQQLASRAGLGDDALKRLTGLMGVTEINMKDPALQTKIQAQALAIQRAWALHQVQASIDALEPGDAGPKVEKASSSRRARVLGWDHPLAQQVRLAKSVGRL